MRGIQGQTWWLQSTLYVHVGLFIHVHVHVYPSLIILPGIDSNFINTRTEKIYTPLFVDVQCTHSTMCVHVVPYMHVCFECCCQHCCTYTTSCCILYCLLMSPLPMTLLLTSLVPLVIAQCITLCMTVHIHTHKIMVGPHKPACTYTYIDCGNVINFTLL